MDSIFKGEIGQNINIDTINSAVNANNTIILDSAGGSLYDGLAIYDYFKDKIDTIECVGIIASAATLMLLSAKNRIGYQNSRYLIHNPFTLTIGDAKELNKTSNDLAFEQQNLINIYKNHLNINESEIIGLMESETIFDANKALEIGLLTEIKKNNINNKTNNNMDKKETKLNTLFTEIKNLFKSGAPEIKNIKLQDATGTEIDFPEIQSADELIVGVTANIDGAPANGEFVLGNGKKITCENGKVTQIEESNSEMDNLKKENETLKNEVENSKKEIENYKLLFEQNEKFKNELKEKVEKMELEYSKIVNTYNKENVIPQNQTPENQNEPRKVGYYGKKVK